MNISINKVTGIVTIVAGLVAVSGTAIADDNGQRNFFGQQERPSFETLDADGDGELTIAEMKAYAGDRFSEHDSNGDGFLSAEELQASVVARATERASANIERMMEWRDTDGDGLLSETELALNTGERMFNRLDQNDDNAISAEEFAALSDRKKGRRFGDRGGRFGRHNGSGRGN